MPLMMTPEEVQELILKAMPTAQVEVSDMTGTSDHFEISVAAEAFKGKTLIEQHKLIFTILKSKMDNGGPIHAVQLKTEILK